MSFERVLRISRRHIHSLVREHLISLDFVNDGERVSSDCTCIPEPFW
jgi:hypothetical protein